MAKFAGSRFLQPMLDLDGKQLIDYVRPTQEEIEKAQKENTALGLKQIPMDFKYAFKKVLRVDLSEMTSQGRIPDPHETEKIKLFELLNKINLLTGDEEEVMLETEEVAILKKRAEKFYEVEKYGAIHYFLEQKS